MKEIIDIIGTPAALETLAEDCNDLALIALKYACMLRGINTTSMNADELNEKFIEKLANVEACMNIFPESFTPEVKFENYYRHKLQIWRHKLGISCSDADNAASVDAKN